jgi:hypothetical protein
MYVSPKVSIDQGGHIGLSPGQVDTRGGRSAPLWCKISRALVHMLARMRQREHQLHKVGLAKNHGWTAMWCQPNCLLS